VTALIGRLCGISEGDGCWSISSEDVARLLSVEPVAFWRAVHKVRDRISFSEAIDGWTQDTVGDLVTVLESLIGDEAEKQMMRAGLFVPYTLGIELIEEVMFQARRMGAAHEILSDELAAMLRYTGSVRSAVGIYLNEHIDLDELLRASVELIQALHGLPVRGRTTALRYLQTMIERHVLDRGNLLVGLVERLRLAAAQLGYIDPEDQPRAGKRGAGGNAHGPDKRTWALQVMGVEGRNYSAEELRLLYRKLMMRHHPDVDPASLEKCKDVNAAYALLISDITKQG
jgi:hypothetical protein